MKITTSTHNDRRLYEIVLSRQDFDDICCGFPETGFIVGRYGDAYFHICDANSISDAWSVGHDGYYLGFGVQAPAPPPGATREQWDAAAQEFYDSIESAINNSGIRPIEDQNVQMAGVPLNLGYVRMQVEKE
ncbi:hypothetical protein KY362_07390 [Candidatus Woesearchaeota archaeon]|nr:hypothetical protein [Candidatus Woesearchaeota archaeon]